VDDIYNCTMAEDRTLSTLNGLWNGVAQVAEGAKKATEDSLRQISGIPAERSKEWIADMFKEFDKDNNGVIDEKELQGFAFSLGETWSEETCKKVFEKLDKDKSGGVTLEEFSDWFLTPGAVGEVAESDDLFTKIALGPTLFARHAQRRAGNVVNSGTGNPVENLRAAEVEGKGALASSGDAAVAVKPGIEQILHQQLRRQVEEASRRISDENVAAVHAKYSKGCKDGIKVDVFKQALSEIRQEFEKISDEDAERTFIDMDVENNLALDIDEFRRALQKPFPIEQAVSALPLSRVISSSLPGLHNLPIDDHLEAFSKLSDEEVSAMTSAVSFELEKLLLEMVRNLRAGFEIQRSGAGGESGAGEKFSVVLSGGRVEDFHAGLARRVGEFSNSARCAYALNSYFGSLDVILGYSQ
jgi:Ca2+-binding EF-hand superfamily protein